jgi:voltage-gated potassium channel Kch
MQGLSLRFGLQALQPSEGQVEELRDHVIIAGFGRVGQIIATLLSERLIPFVAIDVRVDRVQV